jgi:hypothetical protein
MVESVQYNRDLRFSPEWWRAGEARAAAARVEEEKTAARCARMKAEQEERMNREERERFAAARGDGIK